MNKQDSNNTNDHDPILGSQEWPIDLTNDDDLFSDDSSFIICTDDVLFTDDVSWFSVDADDSDDEDSDDDTDTKESDAIHSFGDDDSDTDSDTDSDDEDVKFLGTVNSLVTKPSYIASTHWGCAILLLEVSYILKL